MALLNLLPLLLMATMPPTDVTTIARGSLSGIERPRQVVIRTETDWRALWREHAPEQKVPPVDFATRTVIGVFLGSRSTAGYSVEITGVDRKAAPSIVRYRESRPGRDQMLAQVITSPFHIVSVPLLSDPIAFAEDHAR